MPKSLVELRHASNEAAAAYTFARIQDDLQRACCRLRGLIGETAYAKFCEDNKIDLMEISNARMSSRRGVPVK